MHFEFSTSLDSIIKVIGVGGGGGNAVNNMFEQGIDGVDFIVCNTDMQALKNSPVPSRVRLGANQTDGLGAGANPEVGKKSAIESLEEMRSALQDTTKMVFITAGMGGGTGTGAAPVIAAMAREMGILTVGIVTLPFSFEGPRRSQQAMDGIEELRESVDTLIVIDNNNLQKILGSNVTMRKAFEEADGVLLDAAKGIAEIITSEGYINVDFADVCTIMREGGKALMGTAVASGEERAMEAVEAATSSPLLDDVSLSGARGIVVNITAAEESLRMDETTQVVEYIQNSAGQEANIIYGIVYDEEMGEEIRVTVVATHFVDQKAAAIAPAQPQIQALPTEPQAPYQQPEIVSLEAAEPAGQRRVELGESLNEETDLDRARQEHAKRRRTREEREKRLEKLNSKDYDVHDPESLQGLETIPAYMRREIELEAQSKYSSPELSRLSIDQDEKEAYRLNDENNFLHDTVD